MNVNVNLAKTIGKIKPMHGVGQPPFVGSNFSMFNYLKDAGIPFSRLHDVGGAYGGFRWVDIPNIFRDFEKDPYDADSYDFTFTDLLITALIENDVMPFFRLGVTIENDALIKSYRLDPPTDPQKWAIICEHIIMHYTEGWANGFTYDIKYWEIWNEPDNYEDPNENQMWKGTKEEYYELYNVASKHLKKRFPHLKIGGYASCGFYSITETFVSSANSSPRLDYFIEFFNGFLDYIKQNDCPLDFFSWHSYGSVEDNKLYAAYARKRLDEAGYVSTETICNEWNCEPRMRGTAHHAAVTCSMMLSFQDGPLDSAMFYDARFGVGVYGALFHPLTAEPLPAYYAFKAFNELYMLENQVEIEIDDDKIYAIAARKDDKACIVLSNHTENDLDFCLKIDGVVTNCLITAEGKNEEAIKLPTSIPRNSFLLIHINANV